MSEHSIDALVRKQFGQVAANYTSSQVHAKGPDLQAIVKHAKLTGSETVLDAGCGAGHASFAVAPHAAAVTAYDFTAAMLEQVRKNAAERGLANIQTEIGSASALPFDDASFDRVISRYSAHHWAEPIVALREFHRVLKPGGLLLIADVVAPETPTEDTFLQAIELLRDISHVRDHSQAQWLTMFNQTGFDADVQFTWEIALTFDDWVKRMATPAQHIAMLKTLIDDAPADVREAFKLDDAYNFTISGALIIGHISA